MQKHDILKLYREQNGHKASFIEGRFSHCKERFAERYGIEISYDDWEQLNYMVFMEDSENCRWVRPGDTSEAGLYMVKFKNQQILLAFSESAYLTMTVFPRHDVRMVAALHGQEYAGVLPASETAFREAKRAIAANFDSLVLRDGKYVLEADLAPIKVNDPVPVNNTFADALAHWKPAKPATVAPVGPALSSSVAGLFAQIEARLVEQEKALEQRDQAVDGQIAELESQLAALRAGDEGQALVRQYIATSREFAEGAFAKFREGVLDEAAATSLARLMLSQQQPVTKPDEPANDQQDNGVHIMRGNRNFYRMDGKTRSLNDWAASFGMSYQVLYVRLRSGMTLREAAEMPVRSRRAA